MNFLMTRCFVGSRAAGLLCRRGANRLALATLVCVLAGCRLWGDPPLPKPPPEADYCATARPPVLQEHCGPTRLPALDESGWPTCSLVTIGDALKLAREVEKYNRICLPAKVRDRAE